MSLTDNPDINNAIENKEFDKAVNLYLKIKDEDNSIRLKAISAAINLSNNDLSEKSHKKIVAAVTEALTLNPDVEWSTKAYNYFLATIKNLNLNEIDKAKNFTSDGPLPQGEIGDTAGLACGSRRARLSERGDV